MKVAPGRAGPADRQAGDLQRLPQRVDLGIGGSGRWRRRRRLRPALGDRRDLAAQLLVHREVPRDGRRVDVQRDGGEDAEREDDVLRASPVPAGGAVHGAVVPGLQLAPQRRDVVADAAGDDVVDLRRGAVRAERRAGLGQVDHRQREVARRDVGRAAMRDASPAARRTAADAAALPERGDEGVLVEGRQPLGRVAGAQQLDQRALQVAGAALEPALDRLLRRGQDQGEEQEDEDQPDADLEDLRIEHRRLSPLTPGRRSPMLARGGAVAQSRLGPALRHGASGGPGTGRARVKERPGWTPRSNGCA